MILTVLKEFGPAWIFNRGLYSAKLKLLKCLPFTESFFERKVEIKRIDILSDRTERTEAFIKELPGEDKRKIIEAADMASQGKIKGFSSVEMDYGFPIDWQKNPITGKSCDISQKWYCIPDFDSERGDIKAIWEISRFTHFVTLARAYLATDDKRYYEVFSNQLSSWLSENPYSYGANYKCGQECALRMMNALLAYNVFYSKGVTDDRDEENIAELIKRCYQKILSNFFYAHKCIKNNHTVSELAGMIVGAYCACDRKRLNKAYRLLDKVIKEQFSADGGYLQFSFNYQRLALQVIEFVLAVSEKTGISLSTCATERIKESVKLLYQCQDEKTGDLPNYGSNDGALVFQLSSSGYRDFRPVIGSLYARLFGKRLYQDGIYDEEYLWLGGERDINSLEPAIEERRSIGFPEAGLFSLRKSGSYLTAVANDYKSRPAHMDQLHIDLWANGINLLCDTGTFSYADEKGKALSLTGAHNTVKVEKTEQMLKKGAFLVYNRTDRLECEFSEKEFYGKIASKNGYIHGRRIKESDAGYEICDEIFAKEDKRFEILFHTPCTVKSEGKEIRLYNGAEHLATLEGSTDFEIENGIRSVYYLTEEPVSRIRFKGKLLNGKASGTVKITIKKLMKI